MRIIIAVMFGAFFLAEAVSDAGASVDGYKTTDISSEDAVDNSEADEGMRK